MKKSHLILSAALLALGGYSGTSAGAQSRSVATTSMTDAECAKLAAAKDSVQTRFLDSADYPASLLLNIADDLQPGEIALKSDNPDQAVSHFERAVEKQDNLPYMEPPF